MEGETFMPIYEYECDDCQKNFEELVRGNSEPKKCPACGSTAIHRKLSVPANPHAAGSGCAARDAGVCSPETAPACGCGCGCGCHHHH